MDNTENSREATGATLAKSSQSDNRSSLKRILVIDDDPDVLSALSGALQSSYDVAVAKDGVHALMLLEVACFDAVLLDLMMPVLDGSGFMREFKARGLDVPVIIVSAGWNLRAIARELGADDYLAKPFALETLELVLGNLIRRHEAKCVRSS